MTRNLHTHIPGHHNHATLPTPPREPIAFIAFIARSPIAPAKNLRGHLTMGNYLNFDLDYPLHPNLLRRRVSDNIVQPP